MALTLTSSAFVDGAALPRRYTRDGLELSPPLTWGDAPAGAESWALIGEDLDAPAGPFVHWLLYDLPARHPGLPEGLLRARHLPGGGRQGRNDYGQLGYGGPAPPPPKVHRYVFRVFAIGPGPRLAGGLDRGALERALEGRILGRAELCALYWRSPTGS